MSAEARKAAEARYPRARGEVALGPGAVRNARMEAFEHGYEAGLAAHDAETRAEWEAERGI